MAINFENVRIKVRDPLDKSSVAVLDNSAPDALHYGQDTLTRYIEGDAAVLQIKVAKPREPINPETQNVAYIKSGYKLAFIFRGKEYWLSILDTDEDEFSVTAIAVSLGLELNNEKRGAYKSAGPMTFAQYLAAFDPERVLTLNINEVSDKEIANEWTGTDTVLKRLFSIASLFGAELEFKTELNNDYSLKRLVLNVYRENDDKHQGVGEDKTFKTIRVNKELNTIRRKEHIRDLYTAIRPTGADGLTLQGFKREVKDDLGRVVYVSTGTGLIYAPLARDRFPSTTNKTDDNYITFDWETDYTTQEALWGNALAKLTIDSEPQLTYEVDGYFDTNVGDTVSIQDEDYNPMLILEARVTKQTESFTDPKNNRTEFSNFKTFESQISDDLLRQVEELIAKNKQYRYDIIADGPIVFKDGKGSVTFTARVMDGAKDVTNGFMIVWYVNGVEKKRSSLNFTFTAADLTGASALVEYHALNFDEAETEAGRAQATVSNINDGIPGPPGKDGKGIKSTAVAYQAGTTGTKAPTGAWTSSPPGVAPNQYLWTRVITTYTDNATTTAYSVGKMGAQGPAGKPGIPYMQPEAPTGVIPEGSTWFQTVSAKDNNIRAINTYKGGQWVQSEMNAEALNVTSLSALSANLGTVNAGKLTGVTINSATFASPFDYQQISGGPEWIKGTSTMTRGQIKTTATQYIKSSGVIKSHISSGLDPDALRINLNEVGPEGKTGDLIGGTTLGGGYLTLATREENGTVYSGSLSGRMVHDTGWVKMNILRGTGEVYARMFMDRHILWFNRYRWPERSDDPIFMLPANMITGRQQMIRVPFFSTIPEEGEMFQMNEDGGVFKVSNRYPTAQWFSTFVEYF